MECIKVNNVSRSFKVSKKISHTRTVEAVKGLSFEVNKGEIFGLLGPNGAGKSTTIKMMITVLLPTKGNISILGYDTYSDRRIIREKINVVFGGERGMYWKLSGYENLLYFSQLYKIPRKEADKKIFKLLDEFGLTQYKDMPVSKYSTGMKQKLHFVRALLNDPEIIFLDEPTNGMDPQTANHVRNIILDFKKKGKTIVLATHNMLEADKLCDRILIMNKGQIIKIGKPEELKLYLKTDKVLIKVKGNVEADFSELLNIKKEHIKIIREEEVTSIYILGDNINISSLVKQVIDLGFEVIFVSQVIPELEEVYLNSINEGEII